MKEIKLQPCPFCGGEMRIINVRKSPLYFSNYIFACENRCISSSRSYPRKEDAMKACNTRKPIDSVRERLEELKQIERDRVNSINEDGMWEDCEDAYADGKSDGRYQAYVTVLSIIHEEAKDCNNCVNHTEFDEIDNGCYMCCKELEDNYEPIQTTQKQI